MAFINHNTLPLRKRNASSILPSKHLAERPEPQSKSGPVCSASPIPRRALLRVLGTAALGAALGTTLSETPREAKAVSGLRVFPLREPLTNSYFLMRACQTKADAADVTTVNPIDRLSIEKLGLTRVGVDTAMLAANALERAGVADDAWLWPSITVSAYETAEVLASQMRVRRDRIVPEFSFLDARGVGAMDGQPLSQVNRLVAEQDRRDPFWKPEPGVDGTPNDSAEDVFVRVRQLISKLETQYFGENIVVISPDSDTLSVWQATVMGQQLSEHPGFAYVPGEIRKVRELVQDAYGKEVVHPAAETIFKPA